MKIKKPIIIALLFTAGLWAQGAIESLIYGSGMNFALKEYPLDYSISTAYPAMSPQTMQYNFGDVYEITEKAYEYSDYAVRGMVVPSGVEILRGQGNKNGKIPVKVTYSLGKKPMWTGENFTDPAMFLASEYAVGHHLTEENIVSYNEFHYANGNLLRFIFLKDETADSMRLITVDKQWNDREIDIYGKNFEFDGNFSLQPKDYNNDGYPDFLVKASAPDKKGCLYALHYAGDYPYPSYIYIYGETSDAPKLDRIDRENYFLFTLDEYGFLKPQILNSDRQLYDTENRENNGLIFTSSYENGVITLKGTVVSLYKAQNASHMSIALKKLDGLVWRNVDMPVNSADLIAGDSRRSYLMTVKKELEQGIYRIEATVNGKMTYTEFIVGE
ncbi:MAG: hypothetical protein K2K57_05640 [Oscillospiraceae bacterium]|nr:hypothetical protein [Oscillospiraceae bacterium]